MQDYPALSHVSRSTKRFGKPAHQTEAMGLSCCGHKQEVRGEPLNQTMTTKTEAMDDAPYPTPDRIAGRINDGASEFMHVEQKGPGVYRVDSGSGNSYDVDLESGMCTCPDAGTRGPWCKHFFAVLFRTDELPSVVGSGVVPDADPDADAEDDEEAEEADDEQADRDDTETFAERIERFEQQNPGASAMEAVSQLGINPEKMDRVAEILS